MNDGSDNVFVVDTTINTTIGNGGSKS